MVALLVVIVVSFSPTMTAAVISETGARGRLSELVLAIVVVADLVALVLFSLAMQFARVALGDRHRRRRERAGAAGVGNRRRGRLWRAGRRAVRALPALRRPRSHAVLLASARCSVRSARRSSFEPLLAAMAAGLVIQNVAVPQGDALKVGDPARRAAGAGRLLRGGRRVASARRAGRDRAGRRGAGRRPARIIRLGVLGRR